ncbi:WD-40 repeat protein [Calothrix sp. NIES-4071]|nr:WD-40 repeat protein [Calothrix sp. NIES-4071]BAZ58095.1 WD-40 repeat protein [Calothrix sp. NIES-4105]
MIFELKDVIQAIAGAVTPVLERNETVIKLLQRFNLAPEHPPSDFSGVYAYALVEYGVGKPGVFLELFRHEEIRLAFRKAFDHNNPSIVLSEVDTFLSSYELGDEIRNLGIDVRREIATFASVFIEVAKRSRTPAEVLISNQVSSLHKKLKEIQERFDRLPTLEAVRTEIAQLVGEGYPALPGNNVETRHVASLQRENQRQNIAVSQRMRGWFETLGYVFEKYEVWENNYFEWIINIQGRRGYDRILVRGIEGEAGVKDVSAILASVEKQGVDEGWLVSARRISPATRNEVKKDEYNSVFCYTFDELLDQDADFSEYLNWLEGEIKRRLVDTKYVPLACIKEEIDPVSKRRIAVSRYTEEEGWIDGCIDLWLDDPVREHISILGEFGTGKTWFALHYAWVALQKYQEAKNRGVERPRLPLLIPLRDYAKAVSVESLFSEFFFRKHKMRKLHYPAFEQLNRMGKLLLIFDGFDEMAARVDRQEMINNFWELAKVVVPGAKVILTCRTEHFPEAREGRALLNAELQASTANLTGETPQFEVLELEKFNDAQIRQVLSHQACSTTVDSVMENPELLDLARRPVMTELILEALPDIEAGKPVDMSRVYLYAVRRKMENDIKTERTFTSLADKLYFLCELSWEMLSTDQMSLNYRLFPYRIRYLFGEIVQEEKDLDHWHFDMMGQTMLIRNASGDYTPAHRSLLEFFVAYKFAAELGAASNDFTELARSTSYIYSQAPQNYTWSSYFGRDVTAPLNKFVSESLEKLRETIGKAPLTKAVLDLLAPMVDDIELIIKVIEGTRGKSEDEVGYVGGNAATLAVKVNSSALEARDLSNTVIVNGDFSNASLQHTNLASSNLKNTVFPKVFGTVFTIAISPDGKLLATGDSNCEVLIWSLQTNQVVAVLQGHRDWIRSVAFSPDNKILASAGFDQTVKLWDIQTGNCLHSLPDHKSRVYCIAFSPDGKVLASCDRDKAIKLWNVSNGECYKNLEGHSSKVQSVTISADGKILASGSSDTTIKLWSMDTGECFRTLEGHSRTIYSVAISSDSTIIASGSIDRSIKIWNIDTGECLRTLQGHTDEVRKVVFSNDNKILVSCSYDKTIKIWDVFTGECLQTLQGHTNWVRCVAVSPDSKILISGGDDQTIRQWSITTSECLNILQGHSGGIRSVAISPDNITLASGSEEETIKLWNINSGICQKNKLKGHKSRVNCVAFSPDGKTLASGSYDRTIKLWNVETGECLQTFFGHYGGANSLTFNPKGDIILSASGDQKAKLWDVETGNCLKTLQGHTNWLWSIAVSPDGNIIASGGDDKTLKIWNFNTGECLHNYSDHTGSLWSIAISPDSKTIASGDTDKVIKLWDINTGACLRTLQGHNSIVDSIVFSANGQILVSGSSDKTVKIWDVNTGECLKTLNGHTNRISSVAIDSTSSLIFSGSYDETIKIWDIRTGECLNTLKDRPLEYMNITDVKGLSNIQKSNLKVLGAVNYNQG